MGTDDDVVNRSPGESGLAVAVLGGVVVVVWALVAVGLISFGSASAVVASVVLVVSVIGWIVSSALPVSKRVRRVAAVVVVGCSIVLGSVIADNTPPRGEAVARELEAIASSFADFDVDPSLSMPVAPWEAPVATLVGEVQTMGPKSPIQVVEAALVEQGFAVTVLNEAADGLSHMDESRGPSSDLAASRDRWVLRASLGDGRIYVRLKWTPLVTTVDPFRGDGSGTGLLGGIGEFAGGLVLHWVAALIALLAGVFTLASAGAAVGAFAGWLSRRRDRTSMVGEEDDQDRTDRSARRR